MPAQDPDLERACVSESIGHALAVPKAWISNRCSPSLRMTAGLKHPRYTIVQTTLPRRAQIPQKKIRATRCQRQTKMARVWQKKTAHSPCEPIAFAGNGPYGWLHSCTRADTRSGLSHSMLRRDPEPAAGAGGDFRHLSLLDAQPKWCRLGRCQRTSPSFTGKIDPGIRQSRNTTGSAHGMMPSRREAKNVCGTRGC